MGSCCSSNGGGREGVGGVGSVGDDIEAAEAVDRFLRSRGDFQSCSLVELSLSASNLRNRDLLSESDPMAVIYTKRRDGSLEEISRTEVVLNSLNPTWILKPTITYQFEIMQPLVFQVYDVDTDFRDIPVKSFKLDEQQFLGEASCNLSEIVGRSSRSLTLNLHDRDHSQADGKELGEITIYAEETFASRTIMEIVFRCSGLENKEIFSKSDPFLLISRTAENGARIPIGKTEAVKNNLDPTWKPITLSLRQVGSKENPLTIECFDFNSNGKHDLIGKTVKSLFDLEKLHDSQQGENLFMPSVEASGHHNRVLKSQIFVERYSESSRKTFLDYLAGGYELSFMVAVDFTASNGNPRLPDSLHYIDPMGRPNAYHRAIKEVGEVLEFYDIDKRFPAWGFGARPIDGPVSHCFNLNGSTSHSEVEGVQGVISAYFSALYNVSLAGPTLFGPVINIASALAGQAQSLGQQKYFVLLIITDGVVTDLQETIDAIVRASDLPLSILIVGVGGADFKEMEILDADKGVRLQSSAGRIASRDIVQFVPMADLERGEISAVHSLLAELPSQFLSYVGMREVSSSSNF
ncbi:protein BONZAI 1-like [Wolffia australiana]